MSRLTQFVLIRYMFDRNLCEDFIHGQGAYVELQFVERNAANDWIVPLIEANAYFLSHTIRLFHKRF